MVPDEKWNSTNVAFDESIKTAAESGDTEKLKDAELVIAERLKNIPTETRDRINQNIAQLNDETANHKKAAADLETVRDTDPQAYGAAIQCILLKAKLQITKGRIVDNTLEQEVTLRKNFRELLGRMPSPEGDGFIKATTRSLEEIKEDRRNFGLENSQHDTSAETEGKIPFKQWANELAEKDWDEITRSFNEVIRYAPIFLTAQVGEIMRKESPTEEEKTQVRAWLAHENVGELML